jgi:glycosyltransferase involved in cell wall biosynthesis
LQKKGYNFEIKIGGEGPEKANLIALGKKLNLKNISWPGFVDREYFFKDLNIFVNQSTQETFGLSTIEAMASGCFVVATKTAGSFEIITDKVDGFLTEINSRENLVKTLEDIIIKNDINIQINAFNKVRDNFSSGIVFDKIREIITDIYRPDR